MSTSAALIPVAAWISLNAVTCLLLAVPLRWRWYLLPAILLHATVSFRTVQHLHFVSGLSELWGTITLIGLIHSTSLFYIKRWTFQTIRNIKKNPDGTDTWLSRTRWTQLYKIVLSPRFIRIPYKNVLIEQDDRSQAKSNVTHRKFCMTRILWLLIKISLHLLFNRLILTRTLGAIEISDFASVEGTLFQRLFQSMTHRVTDLISAREIIIRFWFTLNAIWTPILLLDTIHVSLAMLFIYVFRIDVSEDWPDLFGNPLEAYTIGRFWTRFWHRIHLSGYSDYSRLLIGRLPYRITRNAVVKRALMTFSIFMISGLIHQVTTWQASTTCIDYADLQFFSINAVAVVVETALLEIVSPRQRVQGDRYQNTRTTEEHHEQGMSHGPWSLWAVLVHLIGYIWVLNYFVWVVPRIYYPRVYCMINQQRQGRN